MDRREKVRKYLEAAGMVDIRLSPEGFYGRCFFHEATHRSKGRTLGVNVEKGVFCCLSAACGRSGRLMTILIERLGFSYARALDVQAEFDRGVPDLAAARLPSWWSRAKRDEPAGTNPAILGAYAHCPTYMLRRGFRKEILKRWDVGFNRDTRSVTIPVWSRGGKLVGISERTTTNDPNAQRYKHPFERGKYLYGEHRVEDVTADRPLVVVEGQPTVWWCDQAGVPNVVATMTAVVTEEQIQSIARYPYVVLAFDGDSAGAYATVKTGRAVARLLGHDRLTVAAAYEDFADSDEDDLAEFLRPPPKDPSELPLNAVPAFFTEAHAVAWREWIHTYLRTTPQVPKNVRRLIEDRPAGRYNVRTPRGHTPSQ